MRRMIAVISYALLFTVLSSCSRHDSAAGEKAPIKISINQWSGYAYAYLAEEKGFFKKNGVEVELVFRKEIVDSLQLFESGVVDGCFDTFSDMVLLNSRGVGAKVVFASDYSEEGDVIIGRSEIKSLSDLKNKTVSINGVNSFSHVFVLKILEKAGLDEADIRFLDVKAHDVLEALNEGKIDAGHTWDPTKSQAMKQGYHVLGKAGDFPGIILDVLAFHDKIIQERPQDVGAIVRSLAQAREYLKNNYAESITIMAHRIEMSEEEIQSGLDGVHQMDLKETVEMLEGTSVYADVISDVINFYLDRGQFSHIPDGPDLFEPKFIRELNDQ